jgi:hypothetical protein
MTSNSNQLSFATLTQHYDGVFLSSSLAANTYTFITSGSTNASVVTDVLFRSADSSARNFNVLICPSGSQNLSGSNTVQISVPLASGNNGTTAIASFATLAPQIFDIDLAGNRVITLEAGESIYVQNTAQLTGNFVITAKRRDF